MLERWKTKQRQCWRHDQQLTFRNKKATYLNENAKAFYWDKESADEDQSRNLSMIGWLTGKRHVVLGRTWRLDRIEFKSHLQLPVWPWTPPLKWGENHSPFQPAVTRFLSILSLPLGPPNTHTFYRSITTHSSGQDWRYIQTCKYVFSDAGTFGS